jgi:hypothetical protein
VRWKKFSSFGFTHRIIDFIGVRECIAFAKGRVCVSGKTKCAKCAAGKKKLKMRVGKNFKNIRVGFECRLVGLCQVVKELSS